MISMFVTRRRAFAALVLTATLAGRGVAQQAPSMPALGGAVAAQPKIVIVPYTKESEDIRTILESDVYRRIAVSTIAEGFDKRGFTTVDFVAALKSARESGLLGTGDQTDFKTRIVESSRADIYVEAEIGREVTADGTSARVILKCYLVTNGMSLANTIGYSGAWQNIDFGRLVARAIENKLDPFLATTQEKFDGIVEDGVPIRVEFNLDQGAKINLESEVGEKKDPLSDLLQDWMTANAYKHGVHVAVTTASKMVFDEVRVPVRQPNSDLPYSPSQFGQEINRYLRSLGVSSGRTLTGGTIYFTIK